MKRLEKGFTLIELMIVVAIIAILAAVAAPRFGKQIQKSRDAKGLQVIGTWRSAANLYYSDMLVHATTFGALLDKVDTGTGKATFDNAGANVETSTAGNTAAAAVHVLVGKGEAVSGDKQGVKFYLSKNAKTEGEIIISTDETNVSGVTWSGL